MKVLDEPQRIFTPIALLNEGTGGRWLEWSLRHRWVGQNLDEVVSRMRASTLGSDPDIESNADGGKWSAKALRTRDGTETRDRYSFRSPDVTDGTIGKHRSPPVIGPVSVRYWFRYPAENVVLLERAVCVESRPSQCGRLPAQAM